MSILAPNHCQLLTVQEILPIIETLNVNQELKDLSETFLEFLSFNVSVLLKMVLEDTKYDAIIYQKIMTIFQSNVREIRKILAVNDEVAREIYDFAKGECYITETKKVLRFSLILNQIIIKTEFDFLGKIPNPKVFMTSLLKLSRFMSMETFLNQLLTNKTILENFASFFETAKLGQAFHALIHKEGPHTEQYLTLLTDFAISLSPDSKLLHSITKQSMITTLFTIARTTLSKNSAALAFEYIAMNHLNDFFDDDTAFLINSQLPVVCKYITTHAKNFDCATRCAVDLLISICNSISNYVEEEEEYYEDEESPIKTSISCTFSEEYRKVKFKAAEEKKGHFLPLADNRMKSRPDFPFQTTSNLAINSISPSKLFDPNIKGVYNINKPTFNGFTKEAMANFNLSSLVQSCPIFSGLAPIDECEDESQSSVTSPTNFKVEKRITSDYEPIIDAAQALLKSSFDKPYITFLQASILDLLSVIDEIEGLIPKLFKNFNIIEGVDKMRSTNCEIFEGYIHEICRLLKNYDEFTEIIENISPDWEEKEALYTDLEELPEMPHQPGSLNAE
ncbi:hypothetical protein TVAG_203840 [Trichomonas vaginalis G3]|uniref:Uncharacterized protein n=1 Tax=Trichomonas vaginalis (strain ATCC PRA-98 / G3) TaxID=412133 RepID=A2ETG0_TRIV3|nr:hypothetical protein TVAGG3_0763880 [Trichomonas vaginalis G3]EAY04080.1 hypothetical protein TVAG_203840 [Trichomonas vaginalis G3]KAI5513398.1 hypothetical protein TVAGG3_0763880 [Trichomonas vaginalis G3]|eukprot:XP_001316303.1 hypothetical protein [Trichomonas vaginalis G3]